MKSTIIAIVIASFASTNAHYVFPEVFYNGVDYGHWEYVRFHGDPKSHWNIYGDDYRAFYVNNKADAQSVNNRCGVDAIPANKTLSVMAGDALGYYVNYKAYASAESQKGVYHPGPLTVYMGKVPDGKTAMSWQGDGELWFKIYEDFPFRDAEGYPRWPNTDVQKLPFVIPRNVPDGEYLFRIEHLNVDSINILPYDSQAQFYISCAQISVTGGGNGTPGPLTSIPGAYEYEDPILHESTHTSDLMSGREMAWDKRTLGPAVWNGS